MVVNTRENKILSSYDPRAFPRYVLAQYVKEGISERDQAKPPILLELKYRSVEDATMQLGGVGRIRDAFIGFQRHLYD
jgi:EcoEI R protein C-terminal.